MVFHPRVGARNYEQHLFGHTDLKPGWNAVISPPGAAVAVRYIWIGPGDGLNTECKPDVPDAEIHRVRESELPPFEGSLARRHMQFLAEMLAPRGIPGYGAAELQETLAAIDGAAQQPLRGPAASVDARIERDLGQIKQAIHSDPSVAGVIAPLLNVIRDALAFRLTITHASNVLSVLLAHALRLPSPLDHTPLVERISVSAGHLVDRALALKEVRKGLKLTAFHDATYLALLLGNTALLFCRQASGQQPSGSEQRRMSDRRGLYIDEVMAHDLAPSLMHPIDLVPCVPLEFDHAVRYGIVDAGGIYPGAGEQGKGPVDVAAMWPNIVAYAAKAAAANIPATLDGDNNPLAAGDIDRLKMFLLTLQLGRGR